MRNRTLLAGALLLASFPAFGADLVEKIVARVNDRLITASEFEKRFAVFISSPQAGNNPLEARKKLLSELIDEKLLEERAKELSVAATDEEVETAVERVKRQYNLATDAEFDNALKSSNMTRDDLKRQMRNTITLQKVVGRDISSKLDMSDDTLRLEYERRKDQLYKVAEQAKVAEIVIRFDENDPASRSRAAARIEEARAKLTAGTPFADVAKEYSEGNARERGGALGTVNKGELVAALDAAVFSEPAAGVSAARSSPFVDPPLPRDRPEGRGLPAVRRSQGRPARENRRRPLRQAVRGVHPEAPPGRVHQDLRARARTRGGTEKGRLAGPGACSPASRFRFPSRSTPSSAPTAGTTCRRSSTTAQPAFSRPRWRSRPAKPRKSFSASGTESSRPAPTV